MAWPDLHFFGGGSGFWGTQSTATENFGHWSNPTSQSLYFRPLKSILGTLGNKVIKYSKVRAAQASPGLPLAGLSPSCLHDED